MSKPNAESHWARHASHWASVGSPLRPTEPDLKLYREALAAALPSERLARARVLLLGVTPELLGLPWGADATLLAVDNSMGMLQSVWQHGLFRGARADAVSADWRALPLATGSCDLVLGDGALNVFAQQRDWKVCVQELHRVLRPGGCALLRLYCEPGEPESPDQVMADASRAAGRNFHAFKWRLVSAVLADSDTACLGDVWDCWARAFPDPQTAAKATGASAAAISTLAAYRGAGTRYTVFAPDAITRILAPQFEMLQANCPGYELGERFPVALFRRVEP